MNRKLGEDQDHFQRGARCRGRRSEACGLPCIHGHQRRDVGASHRAAIGLARQRGPGCGVAQAVSWAGYRPGRQLKILRRLGVSPAPGHVIGAGDRNRLHHRRARSRHRSGCGILGRWHRPEPKRSAPARRQPTHPWEAQRRGRRGRLGHAQLLVVLGSQRGSSSVTVLAERRADDVRRPGLQRDLHLDSGYRHRFFSNVCGAGIQVHDLDRVGRRHAARRI
jgi:hypothetical protein